MSCVSCQSTDYGAPDGVDFVCFKCKKITYSSGEVVSIRRGDDVYWEIEMIVPQRNGSAIKQWVAISDSFDKLFEQYLARLIIS